MAIVAPLQSALLPWPPIVAVQIDHNRSIPPPAEPGMSAPSLSRPPLAPPLPALTITALLTKCSPFPSRSHHVLLSPPRTHHHLLSWRHSPSPATFLEFTVGVGHSPLSAPMQIDIHGIPRLFPPLYRRTLTSILQPIPVGHTPTAPSAPSHHIPPPPRSSPLTTVL